MAQFDKAVPPGGEGKITLKVNTKGYQGKVSKSARVYSNDPKNNVILLRLLVSVKVPIFMSSRYVYLHALEGQSVTRVVDIRAALDKPLKLEPLEFNLEAKVTYELQEMEPGRRFQVRFTSVPGPAEIFSGDLRLKTNYAEMPEVSIRIRGRIRKNVDVPPPRTTSGAATQGAKEPSKDAR